MSFPQAVFIGAFSLVIVSIMAMVAVVVVGARRVDGGGHLTPSMLKRLGRLPAERSEANRWASYAHRLTGIAVFFFVFLHIIDVSLYAVSSSLYDEVHHLYATALMRAFECGLLWALLFHALNGIRLIAIDVWDLGFIQAGRLLTAVAVLTLVLTLAGSIIILHPLVA
jgi:succinate dehydrogenase / fumarate reductase cytochrome b subunit